MATSASLQDEAHTVIMRRVGPQAVISESIDDLIDVISRFTDITGISNWNVGGEVYLDYINVLKSTTEEQDSNKSWWPKHIKGVPVQAPGVDQSIERLRGSLTQIDTKALGFSSMVAVQEMAKVVGVDV
ncbi:hypothetical protein V1512DRAFT_24859 [Lipomyces arxii]|uniref:uncharacterized protein n=1 Tax=Lipomyces arxii TaxID=56418 RepID=UPI0034CFC11D